MSKLSNKTILITGGHGMVASQANFGIRLGKEKLDILNARSIQNAVDFYKPNAILHLGAITNMLDCQHNPKEAYKINALGSKNIALACKKNNLHLTYLSTCAVFDGKKKTPYKENDRPHPLNVYGKTKWQGEIETRKICSNALIIRTGWLFGGDKKDTKIVHTFFQKMRKGQKIKAVDDRFGSPTYAPDLLQVIKKLINKNAQGIFHIVNSDKASYFEIAKEIKRLGKFSANIMPVKALEIENPKVKRGRMEALASSKIKLRPWQKALKEYLDILKRS